MSHSLSLTPASRFAQRARHGLFLVSSGEDRTMAGWLIYGEALNEGRKLFPSNEQFGQWVRSSQLDTNDKMDRAAAMWAAANPNDFNDTRQRHRRVRTVRGLHAKWKEAQKGEPKVETRAATLNDLRKVERLRALRDDPSASEGERVNAQVKLDEIEKAGR